MRHKEGGGVGYVRQREELTKHRVKRRCSHSKCSAVLGGTLRVTRVLKTHLLVDSLGPILVQQEGLSSDDTIEVVIRLDQVLHTLSGTSTVEHKFASEERAIVAQFLHKTRLVASNAEADSVLDAHLVQAVHFVGGWHGTVAVLERLVDVVGDYDVRR